MVSQCFEGSIVGCVRHVMSQFMKEWCALMCIVSIPFPFVLCGVYFNEQSMLEAVMDVLCCVLCIECLGNTVHLCVMVYAERYGVVTMVVSL